ncbi:hypothetical protein DFH07DRAFT_470139 [Mycena maculata]|uniref:Secreted protein n=1 Tax=Mycena maculata TaxID=230809 RepID=A0AAD7NYN6_9AGAR|nr:hypothetical protein DFH07DRAFT_470139 [Mycena maculata]
MFSKSQVLLTRSLGALGVLGGARASTRGHRRKRGSTWTGVSGTTGFVEQARYDWYESLNGRPRTKRGAVSVAEGHIDISKNLLDTF